jgi:hypothetical protein
VKGHRRTKTIAVEFNREVKMKAGGRRVLIALAIGLAALFSSLVLSGVVVADLPDPTPQPVSRASVSTQRRNAGYDRETVRFTEGWPTTAGDDPLTLTGPLDFPPDPTADIPWSAGTSGVADIQAAFNHARTVENAQLGTSIPMLALPCQTDWDAMGDGEKALWLINRERVDRGVHPLHGLEANVTSVAQGYAEYLIENDAWGHCADGRDPWTRLNDNPAIGACHDFLPVVENLAVFWTSGTSVRLPVERAIYMWMYEGAGSDWGHRHAIVWYPYNDNSGPAYLEGFLGIGRDSGPHHGWNYAEMIVMNVFDPCATWDYGSGAILGNLPDVLRFIYSIPDQRLLPISRRVTPKNEGDDETLNWSITTAGTWFTASPLEDTTPNSLWVTPTIFSTSGEMTYTGALTVTVVNPAGVDGSPHSIDLILRVVNSAISDVYLPLAAQSYPP